MPFWALKNLQKENKFAGWTLIAEQEQNTIRNLQIVVVPTKIKPPKKNTCQVLLPPKNPGSNFFFGGGGGVRFGLKTSLDFAYRVWFSRELRECMNVFIISVSNV